MSDQPPTAPKPLAQADPWDAVAVGYDAASRSFMEQFSSRGIELLTRERGLGDTDRLLDVACGPGTTSMLCAETVGSVDALDFSRQMLGIFAEHLQTKNLGNVTLHHGDGQNLPFEDNRYDYAVSMFGLMFFPDRIRGMEEMKRTLKPGGRALISSWAPMTGSSLMMALFGAVQAIDPTRPDPAADMESLENPELFESELIRAGFSDVNIHEVEKHLELTSPDELWDTMARGAVPLVMMKKQMGEAKFEECSRIARERLRRDLEGKTSLSSVAYLAVAQKPE